MQGSSTNFEKRKKKKQFDDYNLHEGKPSKKREKKRLVKQKYYDEVV